MSTAVRAAACRRSSGGRGKLFKNLKLGQTIFGVVLLLAFVAELISYIGINSMQTYNGQLRQMQNVAEGAILGEQIHRLVLRVIVDSRGVDAASDPAAATSAAASVESNIGRIKEKMTAWSAVVAPQDRAALERASAAVSDFAKSRANFVRLVHGGQLQQARTFDAGDQELAQQTAATVNALASSEATRVSQLAEVTERFYAAKVVLLVGLGALGIALAALALLIVISRITRPISKLTERVTENIRKVAIAATQASSAVSQVSDGSNVQLAALKQSGAALGQSTEAIAEVARSTLLASEQAKDAANLVADGITRMDAMVDVVNAISENSTQISQIAGAISQIASQTNMLALNAAIEAARAGEHGKGFAVVAEEVRKLAENSGALAQEIASLVQQATEAASRGVTMARTVADNMHQIADGVQQSDRLVGAIASAMEEQQATVRGINTNVSELTRIGQSNATAAEEITATMLDLSKLAERSRADVDEFKAVGL